MIKLHSIGKSSGQSFLIEELEGDSLQKSLVLELLRDGFGRYEKCTTSIIDMVREAVEESLRRSPIPKEEIDGIVFSSESLWDSESKLVSSPDTPVRMQQREALSHLLFNIIGLKPCCIYTSSVHGCGNLAVTLDLCSILIGSKRHRNLLVIFADRLPPSEPRVCKSNITVFSDKALCVVVSGKAQGFAVKNITTLYTAPMTNFGSSKAEQSYLTSVNLAEALSKCRQKFEVETSTSLVDYGAVIVDNFRCGMVNFIAHSFGIPGVDVLTPTKFDLAHTFSIDTILSLEYLQKREPTIEDVALINIGVRTFGIITLEVDQSQTLSSL